MFGNLLLCQQGTFRSLCLLLFRQFTLRTLRLDCGIDLNKLTAKPCFNVYLFGRLEW